MAAFPATPKPARIDDARTTRAAVQTDFDKVVRHARARAPHRLRERKLVYEHIVRAEVDTFLTFYKARKGRTERFDFTDPVENVTYQARFGREGMMWRQTGAFDYMLEFQIEEAP